MSIVNDIIPEDAEMFRVSLTLDPDDRNRLDSRVTVSPDEATVTIEDNNGRQSLGLNYHICDPLSKNPAHPEFYENRDKTGNRYIVVWFCSSEKWKQSVAWFPSYRVKRIVDVERKFSRKRNVFTLLR